MSYHHIHDIALLHEWSQHVWHPNETYIIALSARKKYDSQVKIKRTFLMRKDLRNVENRLYTSIRQYEFPLDAMTDDEKTPVPQDCTALYVSTNPRDPFRAALDLGKSILEEIQEVVEDASDVSSVVSLAKTSLQKCAQKVRYWTIDVDDLDKALEIIQDCVKHQFPIHCIVRTRGGYHILLLAEKMKQNAKSCGKWSRKSGARRQKSSRTNSPLCLALFKVDFQWCSIGDLGLIHHCKYCRPQ